MRKIILLVSTILVSTCSFADVPPAALGAIWKKLPSTQPKQDKNDLTIVYGGEDVSHESAVLSQPAIG
ncbi:MAG: hypothetical protein EPO11_02825 [Gammaproteobacteria bacterium]|nr:MAG: hypothetical protein EPO11_02825 [Gammaproteobacteria bacterium]